VPRHDGLVRLTGKHPLNCEPELTTLMECGFNTPPGEAPPPVAPTEVPWPLAGDIPGIWTACPPHGTPPTDAPPPPGTPPRPPPAPSAALHYVRNHGAVPKIKWDEHRLVINGLVEREVVFTMDELVKLPSVTLPVTLVCAGNRRKEENMLKKTIGFSWGPAGVSTSDWTGVRLTDLLKMAGVKRTTGLHVEFSGPKGELPQGEDGSYATSVPIEYANDPANDLIIAYRQNGELLTPDHGFPVRLVIPGFIGGRMIKFLERITLLDKESDNYYHFFDNRVLPSHVDQALANKEGWWYKPEFIINQLNTQSAIAFPAHGEEIPLDGSVKKYTVGGYAYTGNGTKIIRCELTVDGGKTWRLANIRRFEKPTAAGKYWCWVFWDIEVDVAELAAAKGHEIACRAWDANMNTQPDTITWNVMGMMNNCWFRTKLNPVTDAKGRVALKAQQPTQPANRPGGWMGDNPVDPAAAAAAQAVAPAAAAAALPTFTLEECAKHDKDDDCWLVYKGEVFDVTKYLDKHPGGAESITMLAGTDCTDEFDSIHSQKARDIFMEYKIGKVGAVNSGGAVAPSTPVASSKQDLEGTVHNPVSQRSPLGDLMYGIARVATLGAVGRNPQPRRDEASATDSRSASAAETVIADAEEKDPVVLTGKNKVELPLIKRTDLNHNTRVYRFGLPSDKHRLGLPIGKHVFMNAMIDGKLTMRAYTPKTNDLVQGYVDFVIKTYFANEHPRFPEGGKMTQHLEGLKVGDKIAFRGPVGEFEYLGKGKYIHNHVEGHATHFNMIAGGTGITPCWQVLEAVLRDPEDETKISLLFANQTEEDILLRAEMEALAAANPNRFKIHYTLDRPPTGWTHSSGFITKDMIEANFYPALPGDKAMVLMCGPPPMINFACKPNLEALGFKESAYVIF